ncbi:TRIM71 [Mytilus edulis]|uniref:TRIM71 n=1 Tax=Mytilus edulis TaxID=6550 RepID=A0A8S3TPQ0_MYTED|nr:TRIM71 [Mytilus edulis]
MDKEKSRIACINDCKIAVTVPSNNLIQILAILASTTLTDFRTPEETKMTGGIACIMDTLYVAFFGAIRLMDLSGQIQRVVNIPSVNILHYVNDDQMLCVHSKDQSDKTVSCLDFTNDSLCNNCQTKEANQTACYCKDCQIFICDNCLIEHRMKNKNHNYHYQSAILREYKEERSLTLSAYNRIVDLKFMAADIVAVLLVEKLCTYYLTGILINTFSIRIDKEKSRIACINDCKIAVTVPSNNLIQILTNQAPTTVTDLRTPAGIIMTGGITCRMDILYVAFSDAIRLIDLSGQIHRVVNIPNVKIIHSVINNKILYHFEQFPFHPLSVTTDEVGNIIFMEDGVIWQADSEGKNIKIIMSTVDVFLIGYTQITYNEDSKCLLTYSHGFNGAKVYRKLE